MHELQCWLLLNCCRCSCLDYLHRMQLRNLFDRGWCISIDDLPRMYRRNLLDHSGCIIVGVLFELCLGLVRQYHRGDELHELSCRPIRRISCGDMRKLWGGHIPSDLDIFELHPMSSRIVQPVDGSNSLLILCRWILLCNFRSTGSVSALQFREVLTCRRDGVHKLWCRPVRWDFWPCTFDLHRRVYRRPIRGCRLKRLYGLQRWSVFRRKRGIVHELCRRSICGSRIKRMQQLRSW